MSKNAYGVAIAPLSPIEIGLIVSEITEGRYAPSQQNV